MGESKQIDSRRVVTCNYSDQGGVTGQDNIQQMITRAAVAEQQKTKENGQTIDLGFLFIIVLCYNTPIYTMNGSGIILLTLIQFF